VTVLLVDRAPGKLRGELTRFMLYISEGVFVGRLSAPVREGLWEMVVRQARPRTVAVLVYATDTDQGFAIRYHGKPAHKIEDFEGVALVRLAP